MGFLDNLRKKGIEKEKYRNMLEIRMNSNYLSMYLPKEEKEFLGSKHKEQLIDIYDKTVGITMHSFLQSFCPQDLGACYDVVAKLVSTFNVKEGRQGKTWNDYVQDNLTSIAVALQARTTAEKTIAIERGVDDLKGRLSYLQSSPGTNGISEIAREEANEIVGRLGNNGNDTAANFGYKPGQNQQTPTHEELLKLMGIKTLEEIAAEREKNLRGTGRGK